MSFAFLGWFLVVSSTAALLFLARQSVRWSVVLLFQSTSQKLLLGAASLLFVSAIGVAFSHLGSAPVSTVTADANANSDPDADVVAKLADYAHAIGPELPTDPAPAAEMLPDVNTMIERLAARLATTPQDLEGWRLLGWSYVSTARYQEAARAFERALEIDPNSAELKTAYEEAIAKAPHAAGKLGHGTSPAQDNEGAVRSMVDGLAHRLDSSPRDVDGWIHLMRSRAVLGENAVAAAALGRALETFAGDAAATGRIRAAAMELGLNAE